MRNRITFIILLFLFSYIKGFGQVSTTSYSDELNYHRAFSRIDSLISLSPTSPSVFKEAVYEVENAFYNGELPFEVFNADIKSLISFIDIVRQSDSLNYSYRDKSSIKTYAAIFKVMTDSNYFNIDNMLYLHEPFSYDFNDVFGQKDWSNMFVTKLLGTNKGNCHSLPYLYKILAEELGEEAFLSLAPNHIYIKQYTKKTGWFNTELTSASFPIDAWLTASGYVHLDAVRNGVYMDTLSQKESLALTLIDLAKGYERKYGARDGKFMLKSVNKALEVDPNFINALLLKAETQKKLFENEMLLRSMDNPNDLIEQSEEHRNLFLEMQSIYVHIHQLGYRQMPEEMYLDWLTTLQEEREKYQNKNIPVKN